MDLQALDNWISFNSKLVRLEVQIERAFDVLADVVSIPNWFD